MALPAEVILDGTRADYTATPRLLGARAILLTLDAPLGGDGGDRLRLAHDLFGAAFDFRFNVLPGNADQSFNRVNAADQGYVKSRLNRSTTSPTGGTGGASYSVFADVTGDGRINAADQGAVKARLNNALPAAGPFTLATAMPLALISNEQILTTNELFALLA
jgi:hypothetical protein